MQAVINHISEGSIAEEIGLRKGDILLSINGHPVKDIIDYMYYSSDSIINLEVRRGGETHSYRIKKREASDIGFELKPFRTRSCRNKCSFCFVNQLPKGLRKTLYMKDDDYRMSFLYGNFITLTNISAKEKKRIAEQKLSPLYISVHTTNNDLRRKMLGNPKAGDILKELEFLVSHKIRIHAQIVLCPGVNDGEELSRTIKDLRRFYPYVASIAVVPVGLSKYRKSHVKPFGKDDAVKVVETVKAFRRRFKRRHGDPVVHLADEFYLKAEAPFPPFKDYGDMPQMENGVGLIPAFLNSSRKLKLPKKIKPGKIAVFTGTAFMPYLEEFAEKLRAIDGLSLDVFKVENRFFGPSVTVAGLLTGKDILKAIVGKTRADRLLVPSVALRDGTDVFLDNVTLKDMQESLGMDVRVIEPTPEGLLKEIKNEYNRQD